MYSYDNTPVDQKTFYKYILQKVEEHEDRAVKKVGEQIYLVEFLRHAPNWFKESASAKLLNERIASLKEEIEEEKRTIRCYKNIAEDDCADVYDNSDWEAPDDEEAYE